MNTTNQADVDVVVLGAGLAGLTAARMLTQAGHSVRVIEARDRVGGRTLSHALPSGDVIELGAQWLGPGQDRIQRLVREFGLRTFTQYSSGEKVLSIDGKKSTYKGDIPSLPLVSLLELHHGMGLIEKLSKTIPLANPLLGDNASAYDTMTVETWKQKHVKTKGARALLDIAVEAIFAAEPREISFLHFLYYLHAGRGLLNLSTIRNGAQETRVREGFQSVSTHLQRVIGNEHVVTSSAARAVVQSDHGVTVVHTRGEVRARFVVVSVPTPLLSRIEFSPALSIARETLTQRMAMGSVMKCIAVYKRPFWRSKGFSGEALCTTGPVRIAFDDSPEDLNHGAIVGFVLGQGMQSFGPLSFEARKDLVLPSYAKFWGDEAMLPIDYVEKNWNEDPWARGCYAAYLPPGGWSACGHALREPEGRVHWAGTETAIEWNGYMEGAIESGERAAGEVLLRLST